MAEKRFATGDELAGKSLTIGKVECDCCAFALKADG
jgi:hypothetical protein